MAGMRVASRSVIRSAKMATIDARMTPQIPVYVLQKIRHSSGFGTLHKLFESLLQYSPFRSGQPLERPTWAKERSVCYRPCKDAQIWPPKSVHFRRRAGRCVGGWGRVAGVLSGRLGTLASPLNGGGAVIGREKRVLLRHYLERGMPKAVIARQLKISRRTLYNWIEAGELDRGVDSKAVRYGPL